MSASAPFVIAPVELIVILYKDSWKKQLGSKESDVSRDEFMAWTNGVWTFNGESKKRVGHPAPFPRELPYRCMKLFSYVGDVVFDPFLGSGTTLVEAHNNRRIGVGVEIDTGYCELARNRLSAYGLKGPKKFKTEFSPILLLAMSARLCTNKLALRMM